MFFIMLAVAVFVSALLAVKGDVPVTSGYYTAAVYEHARFGDVSKDPMPDIIAKNLIAYEKAAETAAGKKADIVVFPEGGLYPEANRTIYKEYGEFIPNLANVSWNPCESAPDMPITRRLSCAAKDNNIYLVANFHTKEPCAISDPDCPPDNVYIYNTNVIFNRKGYMVALYHKYHLFFEEGVDIPKKYEYVVFKTEFATIGTFVCFDIMWKNSIELLQKYKIDTLVHPTEWIECLPMYSSIQTMSSWSLTNDINLLSANVQKPSIGAVGSGIFLGASRVSHYVYQPNGKSKLIVAKVPIRTSHNAMAIDEATVIEFKKPLDYTAYKNAGSGQCSIRVVGPPKSRLNFKCMDMDLSNSTLVKLQKDKTTVRACNNRLCCIVRYDAVHMNEDYYLSVLNDSFYVADYYAIWEETCMVIRCDRFNGTECSTFPTMANTVFRSLIITANITRSYVYPSVMISGMQLLHPEKWSYTHTSLSLRTEKSLLFAVLNGRSYDRDPPYP